MQRDETARSPRSPRPSAPTALRPEVERTLIASGWTRAELHSPVRSPLANLQLADLEASLLARTPSGPAPAPARPAASQDPNDTRMASDWSWMDAFATMSWADPQSTMVTPSRRPGAGRIPRRDLDATRVLPPFLREMLGAASTPASAPSDPPQARVEVAAPAAPPAAPPAELPALPPVPDLPALMPDIQLMGMMPDTGFAEPQWLVQRGPTFVQLSELLYRVLEQVDGRRTLEEIAALARETTGRPVSANNVRLLIAARLLPLGLVVPVGGVAQGAPAATARSPLAVTLKLGFMPAGWVEVVARALQVFFWPPLLIPILLLIAVSQAWLYFVHGAFAPVAAALQQPLLLTGIEIFIFVSAVFHEFGHASALRYGGGRARGIGFGLYFIFTAFYTDCTDSYRLGRWARLRTDVGGVYFDLITTLGLTLGYLATRQEILLAAVILLDLEILEQIDPIGRYDGYWALADLIGVPDFLTLMKPTLLSLVPTWLRSGQSSRPSAPSVAVGARTPALKGWVKTAFLIYTAVFVPALPILLGTLLARLPGLFQFFIDSLAAQILAVIAASHAGARLDLVVSGASAAILLVTLVMMVFGVVNILRSLIRVIWGWGTKTPTRRAFALVGIVGGLALLAVAWAPQIQQLAPHIADLVSQIRQSW